MSSPAPALSVVIPCFNEEGTVRDLAEQIRGQFAGLAQSGRIGSGEILFVDDGSTDGTRDILRDLCAENADTRAIFFRRNLGKAAALDVGFRASRGDLVLTMDADLQDDPAEIPRFVESLGTFDVVGGWKRERHDPKEKTVPSRLFNSTVQRVTGIGLHDMNCGFKGYRREALAELRLWGELHRYIPVLTTARGFSLGELAVTHHERRSGQSKYGLERYVRGFLDLLTVVYITRYLHRPLHLLGGAGIIMGLVALFFLVWAACTGSVAAGALAAGLIAGKAIAFGLGLTAEATHAALYSTMPDYPVAERLGFAE